MINIGIIAQQKSAPAYTVALSSRTLDTFGGNARLRFYPDGRLRVGYDGADFFVSNEYIVGSPIANSGDGYEVRFEGGWWTATTTINTWISLSALVTADLPGSAGDSGIARIRSAGGATLVSATFSGNY